MGEFINIKEASKITGKSELTIRRLIKKALLSPTDRKLIKREPQSNSKNSPFVYKLHKRLISQMSSQVISQLISQVEPLTSQARGKHKGGATQVSSQMSSQMISQMGDTIGILKTQLEVKDTQIKDLSHKVGEFIERQRETNILLKGLQDKMLMLEAHREPKGKDRHKISTIKEQNLTKPYKMGRKATALQTHAKRSPQGLLSRITGTFTGFWGHRDRQGRAKK